MKRRRQPELMDQPGLDQQQHHQALDGLCRINAVSRTGAALWSLVRRVEPAGPGPLRVLDVASGGGDVALALARRAARQGVAIEVDGCDQSVVAVEHARQAAEAAGYGNVGFFQLDVLRDALPTDYDVVTCTLFLHHLGEVEARRLLAGMARAAQRLVVVDDLRRSPSGCLLAWLGCHLLTRSPIVHTDGPLSAAAAYTETELAVLARRAGLEGARIRRRWPARCLVTWRRT